MIYWIKWQTRVVQGGIILGAITIDSIKRDKKEK